MDPTRYRKDEIMNFGLAKKSAVTAIAVTALAAGMNFTTVEQAEAGKKHFWAGVGAGIVTGIVVNEVVRSNRARRHHATPNYYVEPAGSAWDAHVDWCYDRYVSYSHVDDRYTTHSGYRRRCNSPFL